MKVAFFAYGNIHHIYCLIPYVEATQEKSLILINSSPEFSDYLSCQFPWLSIVPLKFASGDYDKLAEQLAGFNVIFYGNSYSPTIVALRQQLAPNTLFVRVSHGSSSKFVSKRQFQDDFIVYHDVCLLYGKKDKHVLHHNGLITLDITSETPNPLVLELGDNKIWLVAVGNQFLKRHIKSCGTRSSGAKDKIRILYAPTYSLWPDGSEGNLSSIGFFTGMLDHLKAPGRFEFRLKLHPKLQRQAVLIEPLMRRIGMDINKLPADIFWQSPQELFQDCDLLLTDRSSVCIDFLPFNKPIVFLDHNNECPDPPQQVDLANSYWTYMLGDVIRKRDWKNIDEILVSAVKEDNYSQIRKQIMPFVLEQDIQVEQIFAVLEQHPKLRTG